ncbi:Ionotropic receptor 140 [Blattella germanica]|nr:Ionotropic receptor 140 [Blattella germanica]
MLIVLLAMVALMSSCCCSCCGNETIFTSTSGIVASLKKYYQSSCVFLLHTKQQSTSRTIESKLEKLGRQISENGLPTALMSLSKFNHTSEKFHCKSSQPLVLISSTDQDAKDTLSKMSHRTSLSGPIWLLLLDESSSIEDFLEETYIPFDCKFLVSQSSDNGLIILHEVYRVAEGLPLQIENFGYWQSETEYNFTQMSFYYRRSNLQELVIPAATLENPPIIEIRKTNGDITVDGYFGKVWKILEKNMNFKTNFTFPKDGARGSVLENGTANGMIQMIADEEVHMAVDAFGMSGIRAKVVDFSIPLLSTRYCVLIKPPDTMILQWDNFLSPFSSMLWVAMMITVLFIAIHLTVLYYLGRQYGNPEAEETKLYTFSDSLLLVLGIFCQQGHELTPKSYSCRFVCISTYIIAVMIFGTYSATFISFLTVHDNKLPFTNLRSLLLEGGYTFGVSSEHAQNYISKNSRDFLDKTFKGRHLDIHPTVLDGMQHVCNSKHSFLIPLHTALAFKNKVDCNVEPLPDETSLFIPQGIAIAKNSPYKGLLNYNLNKLRANGVLFKHKVEDYVRMFPKEKKTWTRVGLEEIAPVIGFLMAGIVAAAVVLLLEKITPAHLLQLQQRDGVFCCLADVKHIGFIHETFNNHQPHRNQPGYQEFSQIGVLQVEQNLDRDNIHQSPELMV